jgi:hypothetical protein
MSQDGPPKDHVEVADEEEPRRFEQHLTSRTTWLRLFFMFVVVLIWGLTRLVVAAVVIVQFFCLLFTGSLNERLKHLGEQLARYSYQIVRYLVFASEDRPFPFDLDWPSTRTAERSE